MSALAAWELVPTTARRAGGGSPAGPRSRHLHVVPAPAADVRGEVRLTLVGRRVLAALVMTVVVVLVVLAVSATARAAAGGSVSERTVTVQSGQTLSHVAAAELPQLSIAEGVARLRLANRLPSDQVRAGQQLVIPAVG